MRAHIILCTLIRASFKEREKAMKFLPNDMDPAWEDFLTAEIRETLYNIEKQVGENYNPTNPEYVLRFLTIPLDEIKIIWLGQDVYPAEGVATGRAFEVGHLDSWQAPFRQASLRNIVRLIHKNYNEIEEYENIYTFQHIRKEIVNDNFPIASPPEWFASLEKQGVLFLNSAFTCEINKANSHKQIWQPFSEQLLQYIGKKRPDIIWFLWGKEAIAKKAHIKQGAFLESRHPSRCSKTYDDDFLKFSGFQDTMHIIDWLGNY